MRNNLVLPLLFSLLLALPVFGERQFFKVGVIIPLTGNASEYGVAARNGITLAQELKPELFKNIHFTFEDSRHEARYALTALQSLLAHDEVNAIVSWGVGPTQVVAPVTEKASIPLIAITADGSVAVGRPNVIRFNYTSQQYARELMRYLTSCGYRHIGIIKSEVPYFESIIKGMREALKDGQSIETVSSMQPSETDFRSIILGLRNKKYDALGAFLVTGQIAKFYQQAGLYHFQIPFFGTDFFESKSEISQSGSSINGSFYPSMNIDDGFQSQYASRFGNDLQIAYAGNAFDAAMLIAKAFQDSGFSFDSKTLISKIKETELRGVSGKYRFVESKDGSGFDPSLVIKSIQDKRINVISDGQCNGRNE